METVRNGSGTAHVFPGVSRLFSLALSPFLFSFLITRWEVFLGGFSGRFLMPYGGASDCFRAYAPLSCGERLWSGGVFVERLSVDGEVWCDCCSGKGHFPAVFRNWFLFLCLRFSEKHVRIGSRWGIDFVLCEITRAS